MMKRRNNVTRLLRALEHIGASSQSEDALLFQEVAKCPFSKAACSILTGALNCNAGNNRDELLLPVASWIHPLV
jgi:hypothetical protein